MATRKSKGWTLRELARQAGVDVGSVSRLEAGKQIGRADTIARITNALGLDPAQVAATLREEETPPADRDRLINAFGHELEDLSEEELQQLREHLRYLKWRRERGQKRGG